MHEYVVEMRGVSKSFPGVQALNNVHLEVKPGEIHALMGENGAGKSTLMKILNGLYQPDKGEIYLSGKSEKIENPSKALSLGLAMIYQELNPVKDMSVAENIFLGREPMKKGNLFIDFTKLYEQAKVLLDDFGMNISPKKKMRELSTAQKQMIEIIKAVSLNAKVIVMDEPTSSLTDEEVTILFKTIERLKKQNVAIIYISHRLEEVFLMADTATVLRDGQYIGKDSIKNLDRDKLISMMVGRELKDVYPKGDSHIGEVLLEVKNLCRNDQFSNISFKVHKGEILGFYGLVGAGRSEVMRSIFGIDRLQNGEMFISGRPVKIKSPRQAIQNGMAMVTEDRKELGLVLCRSIKENITLASLNDCSSGPFVSSKIEHEKCEDISKKLTVKMSGLKQHAGNLSGGNQQKVVLCKWLITPPKLLILDEPTRGIDVGAKAEIHQLMRQFAEQGMAVIIISSELPEVIGMSDRILVMGEGEIKGEFIRDQFKQDDLLACALGGKKHE
jgi:ABC-type sugar transport system ATPase subunit